MKTIRRSFPGTRPLSGARVLGKGLMPLAHVVFAAVLGCLSVSVGPQTIAVQALPGEGSDISVGADGTAWHGRLRPVR